ncbi:hypothetical protein CYY_005950 [Polysphondylium violaceum]|uniref:PX domain-containing protein n=1 Tax=Polysphondylium violaceum TaxID=133409 RepID=A0A8J4V6D9_9MYCE|nr:hypothetical protein CYY_005950 [Polysphondylium violaceum]
MNATEQQLRNELETLQKLLNTQLTKVAALEDENRSLREYASKIAQLEESNRLLNEQLAGEVHKSKELNEKLNEKKNPIHNITVPSKVIVPEKFSNYTAYLVEVESIDGKKYQVTRRYKQFVLLNTQLIRIFGEHGVPSLPGKKNGIYFSAEDHTEKRRQGLQEYLQSIMNSPELGTQSVFYQFLRKDEASPSSSATSATHH